MSSFEISIKGKNFTISVIYLKDISLNSLEEQLLKIVNKSPKFFKQAPVVLNVSELSYTVNWNYIKDVILSAGFLIIGVSGCKNLDFKNIILNSGIPILSEGTDISQSNFYKKSISYSKFPKTIKTKFQTHIINIPIRSGQKIYIPNGDLIIKNNVNAGAEIISDGNVHIYGIMRGKVLAGANGDITSQIFCSNLFAELISIAGEYWVLEQIPEKYIGKTVSIYLKEQSLIIQCF
ncbi:septum site-determining protein MinC [Buchnera aphidicola]|uniref:septum site-determining protein MinC n=1 Tax=Buchnera aphidicola TaxID=9 RepID=UPI0031B6DB8F